MNLGIIRKLGNMAVRSLNLLMLVHVSQYHTLKREN